MNKQELEKITYDLADKLAETMFDKQYNKKEIEKYFIRELDLEIEWDEFDIVNITKIEEVEK